DPDEPGVHRRRSRRRLPHLRHGQEHRVHRPAPVVHQPDLVQPRRPAQVVAPMPRKFAAIALLLGLVATACGGGKGGESATQTTQRAAEPDLNATIKVGANEDVWPDQGREIRSTLFQYVTNQNVYEPLIYLGSDY